jgi:hypothetical protein
MEHSNLLWKGGSENSKRIVVMAGPASSRWADSERLVIEWGNAGRHTLPKPGGVQQFTSPRRVRTAVRGRRTRHEGYYIQLYEDDMELVSRTLNNLQCSDFRTCSAIARESRLNSPCRSWYTTANV